MKRSTTTAVTTLIIFGTPLAAVAGPSFVIPGGAPIALTAGFIALLAGAITVWWGRRQENNTDIRSALKRHVRSYKTQWRGWAIEADDPGEIESAICGVETYFNTADTNQVSELFTKNADSAERTSAAMLEHAATINPGAFREFDRRGQEDLTTKLARKLFLAVGQGALQELQNDYHQRSRKSDRTMAYPRLLRDN